MIISKNGEIFSSKEFSYKGDDGNPIVVFDFLFQGDEPKHTIMKENDFKQEDGSKAYLLIQQRHRKENEIRLYQLGYGLKNAKLIKY